MLSRLEPLLRPRGIAVVGATPNVAKFSGRIVPALLKGRYRGAVYPVNPRYEEVAGLPCYPSVSAVPSPCDLVIIAVPAPHVLDAVEEAVERGVGAAVILSGGFEEIGGDGAQRAERLRSLGQRIRIYGPNCPGLWQIRDGIVYTFSNQYDPAQLVAGPIGLITQGGALGRTVLDAMDQGLGFSSWFSTGNEAGLEAADFVEYFAQDPGTRVVALIVEGFGDGRRFLAAASACRQAGKPVLMLKIGRTEAGARAARSHTAKVNGSGEVTAALLEQAGCLLVDDVDELLDLAALFARYPQPRAGGLAICSFSGGMGGLLADQATLHGLPLAELHPATEAALQEMLPPIAAIGNPTDLTTIALEDPALARRALETMAADPAVALTLFPLPHRLDAFDEAMARQLVAAADGTAAPIAVVASSPSFDLETAAPILRRAGVPVFRSARGAVLAVRRWLDYRLEQPAPAWAPWPAPAAAGRPALTAAELADALAAHGIPRAEAGTAVIRCTVSEQPGFGPVLHCQTPEAQMVTLLPLAGAEPDALLQAVSAVAVAQRGRYARFSLALGRAGGDVVLLDTSTEVSA